MELPLVDARQSMLNVSDTAFGCNFNSSLVHQVIVAYAAGARQGTHSQKSRAEVAGSGKKPWRQKGTGRARSGSIRSPIWRSGGVTFAAHPKDYRHKVNRKMYRSALRSILSELIRQNRLVVVITFLITSPKTKLLIKKLKEMELKSVFIITHKVDRNTLLASRNLHKVNICSVDNINLIDLISFEKVVITVDAIKTIEERLLT